MDFLLWATAGAGHYGGLTHADAYRKGLAAIRDGLGPEVFLVGCGAPLQHAAGFVNGMRIGGGDDTSSGRRQTTARAPAPPRHQHPRRSLHDPPCPGAPPPPPQPPATACGSN